MPPKAFTGHDVRITVGVEIHDGEGMRFMDRDATAVGAARCNDVFHESASRLFEPCQYVTMRLEARHHVGVAVSIDVDGSHLRASSAEARGAPSPERIAGERGRLLPPTASFQKIGPIVAAHIAHAEPVGERMEA